MNANKCKNLVSATTVSANTSDPTQLSCTPSFDHPDDVTVVTLNVLMPPPVLCSFANAMNAVTIARDHAIADTGATSIFIMEGVDVVNKRIATSPLQINLPDGKQVRSSHICDIAIPGLPTILTGHIVPSLTVASLIGIRPLCKAGCQVVFDDNKCNVRFNGNLILRGYKDPSTDLWTLPIRPNVCATPGQTVLPRSGPCLDCAPHSAQALSMPVALGAHARQCCQVLPSIPVQPQIFVASQGCSSWFPQGVSEHDGGIDPQVLQSQCGHGKGAHETSPPWYLQHSSERVRGTE